tara:strand:- start:258 stop:713 length:456 start_codon:yes stop_codon:yes gene_type:complete
MKISTEGLALIKKFEGCRLDAYLCAAGVPTIAWGKTKDVNMGDSCTQEQADDWLLEEIVEYEDYVSDAVDLPLSQHQYDALVSWTYNLGRGSLLSSTMLKVLNKGEYEEVPYQMQKWNKATVDGKKVVLDGLVRRRKAESLLFKGQQWHDA